MKRKLLFTTLFVFLIVIENATAQTVTLDYYYNHETHTAKDGQVKRFHYMWEDTDNSGFSVLGEAFKSKGAALASLDAAPTAKNLQGTAVYIIVDPDNLKDNPHPNYIQKTDVEQIAGWVKEGGVLILMANDSVNVELKHFNTLAERFGMHFNNDLQNHVIDDAHFDDGAVLINNNPIFKTAKKAFMKDVCSIDLKGQATAALKAANGAVIAAVVKYGKGTVFAVGDPWLYNEYVNGRLPTGFDNDKAAIDLVNYALANSHYKH